MFKRDIEQLLDRYAKFPVVAILGPRQSGKTTLAKMHFKNYVYTNLEELDTRALALNDPRKFLSTYENEHGIIIDEFQHVPHILSYIQVTADEKKRPGYFVLTGSQNYLMNAAITQSLAGRVGILTLLPFSMHELKTNEALDPKCNDVIFRGFYPRIYDEHMKPQDIYPGYLQTYLERDVRQLINVGDISQFKLFIQLCAGRIGQLLNIADLATSCSISTQTARRWLSTLEAGYIVFLLQPYFKNFNKRLTKSPKIYFYDTGLVCSLLNIPEASNLVFNSYKGHLFENLIIADLYKQFCNNGQRPPLYFWRDLNGRLEVDCIIDQGNRLVPIEIKSGETINSDYFDTLTSWAQLTDTSPEDGYVIYGGSSEQKRSKGHVMGWQAMNNFIAQHIKT